MNIVKLQNDLKNVPDNALINYVQNPSGQVPTYLALSELQRRKKMREQASGAQAQDQSQMPSVAEQIVAEATPQAGIAGIPVTNIGNEEAYAAGGIVAFEKGGDVQGYAYKGFVELSDEEIRKLTPAQQVEYNNQKYAANQQGLISGAKKLGAAGLDILTLPGRALYNVVSDINTGRSEGINTLVGRQILDTSPAPGYTTMTPFYDMMIREAENKSVAEAPQSNVAGQTREEKTAEFLRKQAEQEIPYLQAQQIAERNAAELRAKYGDSAAQTIPVQSVLAGRNPTPNAVPAMPAYGAPQFKPYEPKLVDENIYAAELANRPTFGSIADIQAQRRAERGINDDLFGQQRKDIEAERAGLEKQKDVNLGTFLMELGGGLASTPGPTLAAFGDSLRRATPGLIASQRDLRKEQKDLRKEGNEINRLEQARKEAMLANDTAAFEKADDRYRSYLDKQQARKDANIAAANDALKSNTTLEYNGRLKVWEVNKETTSRERIAQASAAVEMEKAKAAKEQNNLYRAMGVNQQAQEQIDKLIDKALGDQEKTELNMLERALSTKGSLSESQATRYKSLVAKVNKARAEAEKNYPKIDLRSGTGFGSTALPQDIQNILGKY